MSFSPTTGIWGLVAALIAIPIIVVIYIIKSRFVQKPVASTFIWKRSLKYNKRKIPMSLIFSLLLVLQILSAILASLAISQPKIKAFKSNEEILIIDASASMLSVHEGKTRFELAKEKVMEYASKAGDNRRVSVIYADSSVDEADCIVQRSPNEIDIKYKLEGLTCTFGEADVDGALQQASKIQEKNAGAKIKLITDKDYQEHEGVEVINIVKEANRVGEVNMAIIAGSDNYSLTKEYDFTADIISYGRGSKCTVSLYVDGDFVETKEITLPNSSMADVANNGVVKVTFTPNPASVQTENLKDTAVGEGESEYKSHVVISIGPIKSYKEAKIIIKPLTGETDSIAEDNEFYIYPKVETSPKILFVSNKLKLDMSGNVDLSKPTTLYLALGANGYVLRTEDVYASLDKAPTKGYDLYIYEGVDLSTMEEIPKDGAIWLLNVQSIPDKFMMNYAVENDRIVENEGDFEMKISPALAGSEAHGTITHMLDLNGQIGAGMYKMFEGYSESYEKILSCEQEAVMLAGIGNGTRVIATSFDFNYTSWPIMLREFILLIGNMVNYSIPDALPSRDFSIGDIVQFNAPAGAQEVMLKYDGALIGSYSTENSMSVSLALDRIGVYEVEVVFEDQTTRIYNLPTHIPAEESNIVIIGEDINAIEIPADAIPEPEPIELFPYIIALLILVLVTEWGVYHRDGV